MEVGGAHVDVVSWGVVLRVLVRKVGGTRAPVDIELVLVDSVFEPIEPHGNGFGALLFSVRMPWQVALSVRMGEAGWGWISSTRVVRKGPASWALWKAAPTSASAADERTFFIMRTRNRRGALMKVESRRASPRKW